MDQTGVIGVMLMGVGATLIISSAYVLVDPFWLVQLTIGLLAFTVGAGLYAVYAIRVLQDVLGSPPDSQDRPVGR